MRSTSIFILFFLVSNFLLGQSLTDKIVVDQFGYREDASKIAVVRNPISGADKDDSFKPGSIYSLVNVSTGLSVYSNSIEQWNNGAEDVSSGDKVWWFDFSTYSVAGTYYIFDVTNNVKSFDFEIRNDIYNELLVQAMRVFYYQRSGFVKEEQFAGADWTDGESHLGPLQDLNCRAWNDRENILKEKDVHGGWYDAGDFNKYTTWTSNYIVDLLRAYAENPAIWGDDYNIPESANGIPDIIDEIKWGMDHLQRLQLSDGSMISVVDAAHASPPSVGADTSFYGAVNTSSTLSAVGAFALGAKIFKEIGMTEYGDSLQAYAKRSWQWSVLNPNVIWKNNDATQGSKGIGAGQQEVDDYARLSYKLRAAVYLFHLTNEIEYQTFFDANYEDLHMLQWNFVYPFEDEEQDVLLFYASLSNATPAVKSDIIDTYNIAMEKEHNFSAITSKKDPYRAHLDSYVWGSNKQKCSTGLLFWAVDYYSLDPSESETALAAAEDYLHYMHGVNPMNLVYMTNMSKFGAENSVHQIYHNWFGEGTDWDDARTSQYGPPPGIVPGGPNPSYQKDACCPSGCGGASNNDKCLAVDVSSLLNQPKQKSYLDFNHSWPLNSWEITENSMGYQVEYIRLLSKFVEDQTITSSLKVNHNKLSIYPNPADTWLKINNNDGPVEVFDLQGKLVLKGEGSQLFIGSLNPGLYQVVSNGISAKIIKK